MNSKFLTNTKFAGVHPLSRTAQPNTYTFLQFVKEYLLIPLLVGFLVGRILVMMVLWIIETARGQTIAPGQIVEQLGFLAKVGVDLTTFDYSWKFLLAYFLTLRTLSSFITLVLLNWTRISVPFVTQRFDEMSLVSVYFIRRIGMLMSCRFISANLINVFLGKDRFFLILLRDISILRVILLVRAFIVFVFQWFHVGMGRPTEIWICALLVLILSLIEALCSPLAALATGGSGPEDLPNKLSRLSVYYDLASKAVDTVQYVYDRKTLPAGIPEEGDKEPGRPCNPFLDNKPEFVTNPEMVKSVQPVDRDKKSFSTLGLFSI